MVGFVVGFPVILIGFFVQLALIRYFRVNNSTNHEMKKLIFLTIFLSAKILFCQDEIPLLHVDSFYESKSEYLIHTRKVVFDDSIGKAQIIQRIKNWSGTKFVNPSEVLVNETQDQLVYNYIQTITFNSFSYKWYVRLIISVKDDKIRLQFYDDGNVFSSYGTVTNPARSSHLKNYFTKEDGIYPRRMFNNGLIDFKEEIKLSGAGLENYIKNPGNQNKIKKDDW